MSGQDAYGIEPNDGKPGAGGAAGGAGGSDRFETHAVDSVHVVRITQSDVLDAFEIEQLKGELETFVTGLPDPRVVLDLGNVAHLSSSALGMLVAMKSSTEGRSGALALANVRPELLEIFKLTRLDKVLAIHDGVDPAVASLT